MSRHAFTHLETHSYYTLLGSTIPVTELAARAAVEGMSHLALTDTNALYGVLAFNRACQAVGVQAIIGMTVTVASEEISKDKAAGHLVLLATGPTGYRSLCRLSSLIQASPEREKLAARGLDWTALAEHREGLICLSGGRRGWIERRLRAGNEQAARNYARRLAEVYGEILPGPETNIVSSDQFDNGGIKFFHAPGHAIHHCCYLLDDLLFGGEVAGADILAIA